MSNQLSIDESLALARESVVSAFGSNLVALLHHGSTVEMNGEIPVPKSDSIGMLLVLSEIQPETLKALSKLPSKLADAKQFDWLVLTEKEIPQSTDVFPDLFLEMKRRSESIFGVDILDDVDVSQHHLRLRCEQQFKALLFDMQRDLITRPKDIKLRLSNHFQRLVQLAGGALWLMGITPPSETDELLELAAEHFGFRLPELESVRETIDSKDLQRARHLEAQVSLLTIVRHASKLIDAMDDEVIVIEA